jgi:hypothetical protein
MSRGLRDATTRHDRTCRSSLNRSRLPLFPRAPHRLLQLHSLLVPARRLRLGAFIERDALGFDPDRPRVVLPPRLVQRRLRARDRLVPAGALLGAGGLFLPAFGLPPPLFLLERRGGLARLSIVDLAG